MVASPTIKVFLVDDHPVVRVGIRYLLEAKGPVEVVGEAETGEEALERKIGRAHV